MPILDPRDRGGLSGWSIVPSGPLSAAERRERTERDERDRLARVADDARLRAALAAERCPHGHAGVCPVCDAPSPGRRTRCPHGVILDEPCWRCAEMLPAVEPVSAARPDDEIVWRQVGRERQAAAQALVWDAHKQVRPRRALVALSGGKDSLVTLALVRQLYPAVAVLWTDDELEYDETPHYLARLEADLDLDLTVRLSPATHAGWFRPWTDRPYWREPRPDALPSGGVPTREWQADEGYDLVFTGVRASESRVRAQHLADAGPVYRTRYGWICNPIWDWAVDEVWAAIAGLGLAYNPVYDRLADIGLNRAKQRVGPLPLADGLDLQRGWPDMYARLVARYGRRW